MPLNLLGQIWPWCKWTQFPLTSLGSVTALPGFINAMYYVMDFDAVSMACVEFRSMAVTACSLAVAISFSLLSLKSKKGVPH